MEKMRIGKKRKGVSSGSDSISRVVGREVGKEVSWEIHTLSPKIESKKTAGESFLPSSPTGIPQTSKLKKQPLPQKLWAKEKDALCSSFGILTESAPKEAAGKREGCWRCNKLMSENVAAQCSLCSEWFCSLCQNVGPLQNPCDSGFDHSFQRKSSSNLVHPHIPPLDFYSDDSLGLSAASSPQDQRKTEMIESLDDLLPSCTTVRLSEPPAEMSRSVRDRKESVHTLIETITDKRKNAVGILEYNESMNRAVGFLDFVDSETKAEGFLKYLPSQKPPSTSPRALTNTTLTNSSSPSVDHKSPGKDKVTLKIEQTKEALVFEIEIQPSDLVIETIYGSDGSLEGATVYAWLICLLYDRKKKGDKVLPMEQFGPLLMNYTRYCSTELFIDMLAYTSTESPKFDSEIFQLLDCWVMVYGSTFPPATLKRANLLAQRISRLTEAKPSPNDSAESNSNKLRNSGGERVTRQASGEMRRRSRRSPSGDLAARPPSGGPFRPPSTDQITRDHIAHPASPTTNWASFSLNAPPEPAPQQSPKIEHFTPQKTPTSPNKKSMLIRRASDLSRFNIRDSPKRMGELKDPGKSYDFSKHDVEHSPLTKNVLLTKVIPPAGEPSTLLRDKKSENGVKKPTLEKETSSIFSQLPRPSSEGKIAQLDQLKPPGNSPPLPSSYCALNLFKLSHFASAISEFDYQIYCCISPNEFKKCVWMKAKKNDEAPCLSFLSQTFDQTSRWVSFVLLHSFSQSHFPKMYEYFVSLAMKLKKRQNIFRFFCVVSGLTHQSVSRVVSLVYNEISDKIHRRLKFFSMLLDPKQNYSAYRSFMKSLEGRDTKGVVPYLPVYLRDVAHLEELPDFTKNRAKEEDSEVKLVNVGKMTKVTSVVSTALKFQQIGWLAQEDKKREPIRAFMWNAVFIDRDEEVLFDLSHSIRPRKELD